MYIYIDGLYTHDIMTRKKTLKRVLPEIKPTRKTETLEEKTQRTKSPAQYKNDQPKLISSSDAHSLIDRSRNREINL